MSRSSAAALQKALAEGRRSARRFDVRLNLRYAAMRRGEAPTTGTGESVNVSRTGLLFRADGKFHIDDNLVAVLDWPLSAPDGEPLKLVLTGQVVRTKRPLVGVRLHTHRLLRAGELEERFESFWKPVDRLRERRADEQRPTVLVDEDDGTALLVSIVVTPENWRIERADPEIAKAILHSGDPAVSLLLTRNVDLFLQAPAWTPAILTVEEGAELAADVTDAPGRVVLRKPIKHPDLRSAIDRVRGVAAVAAPGGPLPS